MKIKISYTAGEKERVDDLASDIKNRLQNASVKRSDRHPPYRHLYISGDASGACKFEKDMVK